jgi:ADP-ribosylglycohydrolase
VGDARGAVTGETQLVLFTAEGLVLAGRDPALAGRSGCLRSVHRAHLRWLKTQGEHSAHPTFERTTEGWLLARAELHVRRAPGSSALVALRGPRMGRVEQPLNSSRDCGGLMRAVAVGLAPGVGDPFGLAREIAALTHGHPTAQLAAGFLALAIREACSGTPLRAACDEALEELCRQPAHEECRGALDRALALAGRGGSGPDALSSLGPGRAAHEALAVALLCALVAPDFETALRLAVNGDGKSGTAAAVAGSLLGAAGGEDVIPRRWLERLELRDAIERTAEELGTPG